MIIATGFFDGVHLGHRFLLKQLVDAASERGDRSMIVTFWPHPRNVLQDEARNLRLLTSLEEKKALLLDLGVDTVEVLNFTKEFSRLTTEQYLKEYIIDRFGGTAILLGYDNRIGCNPGSTDEIASLAKSLGLGVIRADKFDDTAGVTISSTKIRNLLTEGDVTEASKMLGHNYSLYGVVVAGNQIGRTIGFPTANMQLYEPLKLVPACGVYCVQVETLGRKFMGMCNIGYRPTISSEHALTIETNIFDFNEDIYGLDIRISFITKIRDERKFSSIEVLKSQLCEDRRKCLALI
jgi:riboflavin kinase / FMN adenylyltransferase